MTERPQVVVVGSVNRDYVCRVDSPPQPGETVLAAEASVGSGGKGGNQAVAASLAGARTAMIGNVGADENGRALVADLEAAAVDASHIEVVDGVPTGMAFVLVGADGENSIVVAPGANACADAGSVTARLRPLLRPGAVVVTQAEIPVATVEAVISVAVEQGCRVVLNLAPFRPIDRTLVRRCDPLVVNESEAAALLGRELVGVTAALDAARELQGSAASVVITLGAAGAVAAGEGRVEHVPAEPVTVLDTTGAGDAFTGALASSLSRGDDLVTAVGVGVRAGSYAVMRPGAQASYPTAVELGRPPIARRAP